MSLEEKIVGDKVAKVKNNFLLNPGPVHVCVVSWGELQLSSLTEHEIADRKY